MPILAKLLGIRSKIPGLSKVSNLPFVSKLGQLPILSKIPKPSKIPNPLKIPFIARIPTRTKLILVGAVSICLIFVLVIAPMILSLGDKGDGEDIPQEIPEEVAEVAEEPPIDLPGTDDQPPSEVADPEPIEENPAEEPVGELLEPLPDEEPPPEPTPDPIVGGAILEDTTWEKRDIPYVVTESVRIPADITLTIEPGVTITKKENVSIDYMFVISGTLQAHGTVDNPIIFDGGGNSSFFTTRDSGSNTYLDLEYCRIKNGINLWYSYGNLGAFSIRYSRISNLAGTSFIWYPDQDVHIEYNTFKNTGGFAIEQRHNNKVYIQYNLFDGKHRDLPDNADYWIQNRGSFNQSETIIQYNSFSSADRTALQLAPEHDSAAMTATNNYWGTQDESLIAAMIYDRNDDPTCAGYVSYSPYLTEPHPDTPPN